MRSGLGQSHTPEDDYTARVFLRILPIGSRFHRRVLPAVKVDFERSAAYFNNRRLRLIKVNNSGDGRHLELPRSRIEQDRARRRGEVGGGDLHLPDLYAEFLRPLVLDRKPSPQVRRYKARILPIAGFSIESHCNLFCFPWVDPCEASCNLCLSS